MDSNSCLSSIRVMRAVIRSIALRSGRNSGKSSTSSGSLLREAVSRCLRSRLRSFLFRFFLVMARVNLLRFPTYVLLCFFGYPTFHSLFAGTLSAFCSVWHEGGGARAGPAATFDLDGRLVQAGNSAYMAISSGDPDGRAHTNS